MTDKIEQALSEGMEEALGVRDMAAKLAPRTGSVPQALNSPYGPPTIEGKLQQIERLVGELRQMATQVKGLIG